MTHDELLQIEQRWLQTMGDDELLQAVVTDLARVLAEVKRLNGCCDELTRQYARLCTQVYAPGTLAVGRS